MLRAKDCGRPVVVREPGVCAGQVGTLVALVKDYGYPSARVRIGRSTFIYPRDLLTLLPVPAAQADPPSDCPSLPSCAGS